MTRSAQRFAANTNGSCKTWLGLNAGDALPEPGVPVAGYLREAQLAREGADRLLVLAEDVGVLQHHRHARDARLADGLGRQRTGFGDA